MVAGCPLVWAGNASFRLVRECDLYLKHGLPVVAGGQWDQPQTFMDATDFVANERAYWRAKLGLRDA